MEFDGTFELEGVTVDEVWLALSDPVLIQRALPGCEFLVQVDEDHPDFEELAASAPDRDPSNDPAVIRERAFREGGRYAALVELGVGSITPSFETVVTLEERDDDAHRMTASGEGSAGNSSFEMRAGMTLAASGDGVTVEWWTEADVFGRIAQMGQRVLNPVANRVIKRFFKAVQSELDALEFEDDAV
ncbi:MAG: CoxG family protein [Halobacteriaceae archaeon]